MKDLNALDLVAYQKTLETFTEAAIEYVGAKKIHERLVDNSVGLTDFDTSNIIKAAAQDKRTAIKRLLHAAEEHVATIGTKPK